MLKDIAETLSYYFQTIILELSKDINTDKRDYYSELCKPIDIAIEQLSNPQTDEQKKQLDDLRNRRKIISDKMNADNEVAYIRKQEEIALNAAVKKFVLRRDLIKQHFEKALVGDHSAIDYYANSLEVDAFIITVLNNFFLFLNKATM